MPRRLRPRQEDFGPGTSRSVEGPFTDEDGNTVAVAVKVRGCDEPHGSVEVTRARNVWHVELPPDTVYDLGGLVGDDGVLVRLTIVAGGCNDDRPIDTPEPFEPFSGVVADASVADIVGDVGDDDDLA